MYGIDILVQKVMLLTVMVILGVILRKTNKVDGGSAKTFSNIVIYLAQPAMIIYSFLDVKFSFEIIYTAIFVFVAAIIFHFMDFGISVVLFRKAPEKQKVILTFAGVFTNAGFMGIPLIAELFGSEAAVYATFYVVAFNIFNWSLGCYIYTKDKSYMSPKKMFINPATIPTYIGLFFFILGGFVNVPNAVAPLWLDFIVPIIKDNVLFLLKSCVIPLSMMMIGFRLAESKLGTLFKDRYIPIITIVRLLIIPVIVMFVLKMVQLTGILPENVFSDGAAVLVISASTPVAAMASIFAERYDGDAVYAGKIVSLTTVISMITMPIIAMLLLKIL